MNFTPGKEQVFDARSEVGHTQKAAAEVLGVSFRTWQDWECGIRQMPANQYALYRHLTGITAIPFIPFDLRASVGRIAPGPDTP